jgi:hypothetical protein
MTGSMRKKLIVLKKNSYKNMGTAYRRNADAGNLKWQLLICDRLQQFCGLNKKLNKTQQVIAPPEKVKKSTS